MRLIASQDNNKNRSITQYLWLFPQALFSLALTSERNKITSLFILQKLIIMLQQMSITKHRGAQSVQLLAINYLPFRDVVFLQRKPSLKR